MLQGMVAQATMGAIGFDTVIPLTGKSAQEFADKGYRFCVRYVSRTDPGRLKNAQRGCADLSEIEGQAILDAGLALMVVQHVARTGWVPSPKLGDDYGAKAADYSALAGIPAGVNVWLDLEDIPKGVPNVEITGYCNAWFARVAAAGYVPGVYVGFNVWLSPDELFFDLNTRHYWRAAGQIPDIAHRGYQMFQSMVKAGPKVGQDLDRNVAKPDALGGAAIWLAR